MADVKQEQQDSLPDIQTITILIDDLRSVDTLVRIASFKSLRTIAAALGPERTRTELMPYLTEFVDDDDEVLAVLATELGQLVGYVGGAQHVYSILEPLEALCAAEEASVREKTTTSVSRVISCMDEESYKYAVQMMRRLCTSEWYTARCSATALFETIYPLVNESLKRELHGMCTQLCVDDTPMVRRGMCQKLPGLIVLMEDSAALGEILPAFYRLAKDEQDSVRLLVVDPCIALARVSKRANEVTRILPSVFALCTDKSWRVRYMVASRFCQLCTAVGENELKGDDLADCFVRLLTDTEAEVRTSAAARVGETGKILGPEKTLRTLMTPLARLVHDPSQHVRVSLAEDVMSLAAVLPRQQVLDRLIPLFLQLLKDTHPDVRLNLISRLDAIHSVIGVDVLAESLLPAISHLAMDRQWRVRLAIIERIPKLAQLLGASFYEEKLADLCMSWVGDQVSAVRDQATLNISKLSEVFGPQWAKQHMIPKVLHLSSRRSYLYRVTSLSAVSDLAPVLGKELTTSKLLPVALLLLQDPVPNVRLNVAKTLGKIAPHVSEESLKKLLHPALVKLTQDTDSDVVGFAEAALRNIASTTSIGGAQMNGVSTTEGSQ